MPTVAEATKGNAAASHGNFFWDLKLDGGQEAWGLFNKDIEVGEEVVISGPANGRGQVRVKRPEKDERPSNGSKSSGKSYEADPKKLRSENARSALHAAKDLVVADKLPLEEMGIKTKQFYAFIESHAGVDSSGEA